MCPVLTKPELAVHENELVKAQAWPAACTEKQCSVQVPALAAGNRCRAGGQALQQMAPAVAMTDMAVQIWQSKSQHGSAVPGWQLRTPLLPGQPALLTSICSNGGSEVHCHKGKRSVWLVWVPPLQTHISSHHSLSVTAGGDRHLLHGYPRGEQAPPSWLGSVVTQCGAHQ